jgi:hypothetical protein
VSSQRAGHHGAAHAGAHRQGTLDILGAPTQEEQSIDPDVEKTLGRSPGTSAEWAQRNIAAFR